jgi:hypothetical protein
MDPNLIVNRLVRLARLDTAVFDEVRDDPRELVPALIVAGVASLLAGLGAFLFWQTVSDFPPDDRFLNTVIFGTLFTAAMYFVAALVIYVVMAQMFRIQVDLQALIRTMGYGAAPLGLSLIMFIPMIWPVFAIVPLALLFVFMIYAVQTATDADSSQVVAATTIGFTVMVLVLGFLAISSNTTPIGAGLFGVLSDYSF